MVRLRESPMVGAALGVLLLRLVCESALGRDVKLVICPQKVSAEAGKCVLFPPQALLTDGDPVPLYDKAIKALPGKASDDQVQPYLKMPIDKLPVDQAEQTLKPYIESLKCAAQAAKCRECKWPAGNLETVLPKFNEYRRLALVLRLWARLEISSGEYEGAALALQTGFGMARHFMQAPSMLTFLSGLAVANGMCGEIEQWVQMEEAPNLYAAFAALPTPFMDVEKVLENEKKTFPSEPPAGVTRAQFESQLKLTAQSHDRVRAMAKRFDRDLLCWQCLEAIRSYAGSQGGQLPQALADIKEVSIPKDPMTGAAFRYTRTGATAVLESPVPAGGDEKDAMRYEITVKN